MDNISSVFTKLHTPGMTSCWKTQNETHQADRLSFSNGLELLLQSELESRRNNRIDKLIRNANFKQRACIKELENSDAKGIPAENGAYPPTLNGLIHPVLPLNWP